MDALVIGVTAASQVARPFPMRAVATSGSYARGGTIAGRRYAHLSDPRTLSPGTDPTRAATAVAPDCLTANALSTAACVLD